MSRKCLSLILLFVIHYTISSAQEKKQSIFDSATEAYVKELRAKKIDTILLFRNELPQLKTTKAVIDCNQPNFPGTFVLWLKSGKSYITKIDTCFTYSVKEVNIPMLWNFVRENATVLQKEKLKAFQYYFKNQEDKEILMDLNTKIPYGKRIARLLLKKQSADIVINEIDLMPTHMARGRQGSNIHYAENMALKAIGFFDQVQSVVYPVESMGMLEKSNR